MRKKPFPFLLLASSIASAIAFSSEFSLSAKATKDKKSLFDLEGSSLKEQELYSDASSGSKGYLLYGYQKGMSASFKKTLNGVFESDILVLGEDGSPSVSNYTLHFQDQNSDKSFSFGVNTYSGYSEAYVEYKGQKAGITYYQVPWNLEERALGYTAGYNAGNKFTHYAGNETYLRFDPISLSLSVKGDGGKYLTVWDFSSSLNDGKYLENDLGSFFSYTVSISFNNVISFGKASLLLKEFGGYSFDQKIEDVSSSLVATFSSKGIVGSEYLLPTPIVNNPLRGNLDNGKVKVRVHDKNKKIVAETYRFTPLEAGNYYVYYEYEDENETVGNYYKLPVVSKESASSSFQFMEEYSLEPTSEKGIHEKIHLPKAHVKSDLFVGVGIDDALLTIKKDGSPIEGYTNAEGDLDFSFDSYGEYEIIYHSKKIEAIEERRLVSVKKEVASLLLPYSLSARFDKGSSFEVLDGKAYQNDSEVLAEASLVYPSGKETKGKVTLSEAGKYTLFYQATLDGKNLSFTKNFFVYDEYASLFEGEATNVNFANFALNNRYNGVKISLKESVPVVYKKIIDLNDLEFDESLENPEENKPFLELRAAPHSMGINDCEGLYVTLTDTNNSNNVISIRTKFLSYMPNFVRIRAKATGQGWAGNYYNFNTGDLETVDNAQMHEDGGFIGDFDFTATKKDRSLDETPLKLYFNNDSGRLYSKPWQLTGTADGYKENRVSWVVRDFSTNDSVLSGGDTAWTGFSNGKVELAIYAMGVSSTADFLVTSIGGEELSNAYIQNEKGPEIILSKEGLTNGEVGKPYAFPSFEARSEASYVATKTVAVYQGNNLIKEGGDSFTPTSAGSYKMVFIASDYFGNQTTIAKDFEILNFSEPMKIELDGNMQESATLGDFITLPKMLISGGVGEYETSVSVTSNNEDVPLTSDGRIFIDRLHDYVVRFMAKDYVGNTAKVIRYIRNIQKNPYPVVDASKIYLPDAFFEGDEYDLFTFSALAFNNDGTKENVAPKITITDANGPKTLLAGEKYRPCSNETIKTASLKFSFQKGDYVRTYSREIPILKSEVRLGFIESYFVGSACEVEAHDDGISLKGTSDEAKASFARKVFAKEFSLTWKGSESDSYRLSLHDSLDYSKALNFDFTRRLGKLYLSVNGSEEIRFYEDGDGLTGLSYREKTNAIYDSRGNEVFSLDKLHSSFEGFASGELYFSFQNIQKGASLSLKSLDNQILNNVRRDSIGPDVYLPDSLSGRYQEGAEVKIPTVYAYDILSGIKEGIITISCNGEVLETMDLDAMGKSYVPQKNGTYTITYSFMDTKGNRTVYSYYFSVYDSVVPTLELLGAFPKSALLGEDVKLPSYQIHDQVPDTVTLLINVIDPEGEIVDVKHKSFKATKKGVYSVNYLLIDENGNVNFYTFDVLVK